MKKKTNKEQQDISWLEEELEHLSQVLPSATLAEQQEQISQDEKEEGEDVPRSQQFSFDEQPQPISIDECTTQEENDQSLSFFNEEDGAVLSDGIEFLKECETEGKLQGKTYHPLAVYNQQAMFLRWFFVRGFLNKQWIIAYRVPLNVNTFDKDEYILHRFCRDVLKGKLLLAYFNEAGRSIINIFFNEDEFAFPVMNNIFIALMERNDIDPSAPDKFMRIGDAALSLANNLTTSYSFYSRVLGDMLKTNAVMQGQFMLERMAKHEIPKINPLTTAEQFEQLIHPADKEEDFNSLEFFTHFEDDLCNGVIEFSNCFFGPLTSLSIPFSVWSSSKLSSNPEFSAMVRLSPELIFRSFFMPVFLPEHVETMRKCEGGTNRFGLTELPSFLKQAWYKKAVALVEEYINKTCFTKESSFSISKLAWQVMKMVEETEKRRVAVHDFAVHLYCAYRFFCFMLVDESIMEEELHPAVKHALSGQFLQEMAESLGDDIPLFRLDNTKRGGHYNCPRLKVRTLDPLPLATLLRPDCLEAIRKRPGMQDYSPNKALEDMGKYADYQNLNVFDFMHCVLFDVWSSYGPTIPHYKIKSIMGALKAWSLPGVPPSYELEYQLSHEPLPRHLQLWDIFKCVWNPHFTTTHALSVSSIEKPSPAYLLGLIPFCGPFTIESAYSFPAMVHYWYQEVQAEIVAMDVDSIEFLLPRPVEPNKIHEIACSLVSFCPDLLVKDAFNSLGELKRYIGISRFWHLQWHAPAGPLE